MGNKGIAMRWKGNRPEEEKGLITAVELAHEWDLGIGEISRMVNIKGMPHVKIGHKNYFDLKECQRWYRQYAW